MPLPGWLVKQAHEEYVEEQKQFVKWLKKVEEELAEEELAELAEEFVAELIEEEPVNHDNKKQKIRPKRYGFMEK